MSPVLTLRLKRTLEIAGAAQRKISFNCAHTNSRGSAMGSDAGVSCAQRAGGGCRRLGRLEHVLLLYAGALVALPECVCPDVPVKPFVAQGPAAFQARAAQAPQDATNYLMGSQACELQGDYVGAIEFLERGIANIPDVDAHFHLSLGQLHARVGNASAARGALREGLRRDLMQPKFLEMLAVLEEDSGSLELADRLYQTAYRATGASNQRSFRLNRISFLFASRRWREAARLFLANVGNGSSLASPAQDRQVVTQGLGFVGGRAVAEWGPLLGGEFGRVECLHAYMARWRASEAERLYWPAMGDKSGDVFVGGAGVEQLRHLIAAQQHPLDCRAARAVILKMEHDEMGFSAVNVCYQMSCVCVCMFAYIPVCVRFCVSAPMNTVCQLFVLFKEQGTPIDIHLCMCIYSRSIWWSSR